VELYVHAPYTPEAGLGYRLDGWNSILGRDNDWTFSLHHSVQTSSVAYPASYPMANGSFFLGDKAARGLNLTTHLYLVPRIRTRGAVPPLPHTSSRRGTSLNTEPTPHTPVHVTVAVKKRQRVEYIT
jgi:hypothetical protein